MAKSKKVRRSSIRHMAADDAFSVLEALEAAEKKEQPAAQDGSESADDADDEDAPKPTPELG